MIFLTYNLFIYYLILCCKYLEHSIQRNSIYLHLSRENPLRKKPAMLYYLFYIFTSTYMHSVSITTVKYQQITHLFISCFTDSDELTLNVVLSKFFLFYKSCLNCINDTSQICEK